MFFSLNIFASTITQKENTLFLFFVHFVYGKYVLLLVCFCILPESLQLSDKDAIYFEFIQFTVES